MPATNPLDNPESWVDLRSPFDVTRPMFGGVTNNFDIFNYDQEMVGREDDGLGNEFLPAYGITEEDIFNYFNTPGLTPQQAVATMQQYGIEPESIAHILGITPEDARSQYTNALATAPTTTAPVGTAPPPAAPAPTTPPPADSNIVMDAVREVGKVFDAGLKAFGDLIGGFDLSAVILNPVNPKATVVFGPPSGSPVTVIGNMPTSKAPIGVNTGIPALDAIIATVFAGKNNNRPIREVIEEAIYDAVSNETGVDVEEIIKGTETGLEGVVDEVEKVVTGLDAKTAEVESVQRPAIIADWYDKNRDLSDEEIAGVMDENGVTPEEMAGAIGEDPAVVKQRYDDAKKAKETAATDVDVVDDFNQPDATADGIQSETSPWVGRDTKNDVIYVDTPKIALPEKGAKIETPPPPPPLLPPLPPVDTVITDNFPPDWKDPIEPPIEPPIKIPPPPPTGPLPETPVKIETPVTPPPVVVPPVVPPPIVTPDGPPPPRVTDDPDLTPVIGGALGGLFGAITPTPITDSIFAPEKVKFNRLPLDITSTLFGGFRR